MRSGPPGGGADIGPSVQAGQIPAMALDVDGTKYFLYHHTSCRHGRQARPARCGALCRGDRGDELCDRGAAGSAGELNGPSMWHARWIVSEVEHAPEARCTDQQTRRQLHGKFNDRAGTVPRGFGRSGIEKQTAKLPSDTFLWAALASIAVSASLQFMGNRQVSNFVGQWAPTFLILRALQQDGQAAGLGSHRERDLACLHHVRGVRTPGPADAGVPLIGSPLRAGRICPRHSPSPIRVNPSRLAIPAKYHFVPIFEETRVSPPAARAVRIRARSAPAGIRATRASDPTPFRCRADRPDGDCSRCSRDG